MWCLWLWIFCILVFSKVNCLILHHKNGSEEALSCSPTWMEELPYFNITGELVASNPGKACDTILNPEQLSGKIALVQGWDCNFEQKIRNIQKQTKAIGVVIYSTSEGIIRTPDVACNWRSDDISELRLPTNLYNELDPEFFTKFGTNLTVTIEKKTSVYRTSSYNTYWKVLYIFMIAWGLFNYILGFIKWAQIVKLEGKLRFSISQTGLLLQYTGSFITTLGAIVDWQFMGYRIPHSLSLQWSISSVIFVMPSVNIIIDLFWRETASCVKLSESKTILFTRRYKIQFAVCCAVIVAIYIMGCISSAMYLQEAFIVFALQSILSSVTNLSLVLSFFNSSLLGAKMLKEPFGKQKARKITILTVLIATIVLNWIPFYIMLLIASFSPYFPVTISWLIVFWGEFIPRAMQTCFIFTFSTILETAQEISDASVSDKNIEIPAYSNSEYNSSSNLDSESSELNYTAADLRNVSFTFSESSSSSFLGNNI